MENKDYQQVLIHTTNQLTYTFGIVSIVTGAGKFANILTTWEQYQNPSKAGSPFPAKTFMKIHGVIEIIAGISVLKKAGIGGYIVAAWFIVIAMCLLKDFNYMDVAVRDLVMAVAAFSMARISKITA